MLTRYAKIHELIVGLIRHGIDRGEIREDVDADWEASALVAFLDGIRLQWFYSGRTLDLETSVERYFDLLVGRLSVLQRPRRVSSRNTDPPSRQPQLLPLSAAGPSYQHPFPKTGLPRPSLI